MIKKGWGFVATSVALLLAVGYLLKGLSEDISLPSDEDATAVHESVASDMAPGQWSLGKLWKAFSGSKHARHTTPVMDAERDRQLQHYRAAAQSLTLLSNRILPLSTGETYLLATPPGQSFPTFSQSATRFASLQEVSWMGGGGIPANSPGRNKQACVFLVESFGDQRDSVQWWDACRQLSEERPVVVVHFGALSGLQSTNSSLTILHLPERNEWSEDLAAQALFGAMPIEGKLPRAINSEFRLGSGLRLPQTRLQYAMPEVVGIDHNRLARLDEMVLQGISRRAMPGGQLLIAKAGKIIYEKSFGYHTYGHTEEVSNSDVYDLASLTKAVGTTLAVMRLQDQGKINLSDRLKSYLGQYDQSGIKHLRIQHLLAHHSGLQANLPVSAMMNTPDPLSSTQDATYNWPLGKNLFLNARLRSDLLTEIKTVSIDRKPGLRYSDINFVLLQQVVESASHQTIDQYLQQNFYGPMGLHRIGYKPTQQWPLSDIVPTAIDNKWRGGLIHGYPHDEGAFLLGGVAGNAGLFGNAADVAAVFQMLLNGGQYNGREFFKKATVDYFTRPNGYNYRALGFDRLSGGYGEVLQAGASALTFGHTGFSGVCAWADPENELIFVFLTNRIHPSPDNEKFLQMKLRSRIHREIYEALGSFQEMPTS